MRSLDHIQISIANCKSDIEWHRKMVRVYEEQLELLCILELEAKVNYVQNN